MKVTLPDGPVLIASQVAAPAALAQIEPAIGAVDGDVADLRQSTPAGEAESVDAVDHLCAAAVQVGPPKLWPFVQ